MSGSVIAFESFRLDVADARLLRGTQPVALTPRAFDVLAYLATHAGRLVSKEELLNSLWDDTLVSDASLVVCIREIRKALGDNARAPTFIETAHRRGYRFIADIVEADASVRDTRRDAESLTVPDMSTNSRPQRPEGVTASHSRIRTPDAHSIVGRDEQLAELQQHLRLMLAGQRQTVFIAGEAGAGKTSLTAEFVARQSGEPLLIAEGQCFEQFGEGEPYLPVLEALTQLAGGADGERVVDALTQYAPTWLTQMPSLRNQMSANAPDDHALGSSASRMLREMAETLEAIAAQTPLILILEDLHWCDYSTLDLVSYIARRRQPARLLVIGTYRPIEVILRDHALKPVKRELLSKHACAEIPLASISPAAVGEYLQRRFPDMDAVDQIAADIYRRTDGHPLFVVELVGFLAAHDKLVPNDTHVFSAPLPDTIRAMIDTQIDLVDDHVRHLLEAGSVAGVEFSAAAVAQVLGADIVEVEDHLDSLAERQQLLRSVDVARGSGPPSARYRFRHVLYQESLYERCPAARRARLHRGMAETLEQQHSPPPPELAAELATHFERARISERAVYYFRIAADRASRHYANREAAEYLSRALELTEQDSSLADLRLALIEQRGLIHRSANNIAAAAQDFEEMARAAANDGKSADQANAQFYLASVFSWVDLRKCLEAAAQAVQLAECLDDELHRRHLRGWSAYWNLLWEGWTRDDATACADAVDAARNRSNRELLGLHLGRLACFYLVESDYAAACRAAEEAMQLAVETGDASEFLVATIFRAWSCLYAGRWQDMLRLLRDGLRIAEINGHSRYALLLRLHLAQLCVEAGDYDQAVELADRSLREAIELNLGYGQLVGPIILAFACLGQHRTDEALNLLEGISQRLQRERLLMDWIWQMPLRYGLAQCHLQLGNTQRVRDEALRLPQAAAFPRGQTHEALAHLLLCEVALIERDPEAAQSEIEQALAVVSNGHLPLAEWRVLNSAARVFADSDPPLSQDYESRSNAAFEKLVNGLDSTLRPITTAIQDAEPAQAGD